MTGVAAAARHVRRPRSRYRDDPDGSRSHARFLQQSSFPARRSFQNDAVSFLHEADYSLQCAGIFLLAGVGVSLSMSRGKLKREMSWFLVTRGLWLIVLELTLSHFGFQFSMDFPQFLLVLWALGWSMVVLAALIYLPGKAILVLSLVVIAGHYAFAMWQGRDGSFLGLDTGNFPAWYGTSLAGVYLAWFIVVALLYVPCRWFARLKARRTDW